MTVAEFGKKLQKEINVAQRNKDRMYEEHKIHTSPRYAESESKLDEEDVDDTWFETVPD